MLTEPGGVRLRGLELIAADGLLKETQTDMKSEVEDLSESFNSVRRLFDLEKTHLKLPLIKLLNKGDDEVEGDNHDSMFGMRINRVLIAMEICSALSISPAPSTSISQVSTVSLILLISHL